jgi:sideroflexin-5
MLLVATTQLERSVALIEQARDDKASCHPRPSDAELWHAQKIKDAILHPDTGQPIFLPLRMSAFVPVGVIFVLGMLRPNPSLRSALAWQWANQSSNALINYANRNATADERDGAGVRSILEGYSAAVCGSCAIAFGATRALESGRFFPPRLRRVAALFVPLLSVCGANSFSLCVIRRRELQQGIDVVDESGEVVGRSQVAARKAMGEMVLSRGVFLPSTVLGLPPLAMAGLDKLVGDLT